jgi:hypothetical protein
MQECLGEAYNLCQNSQDAQNKIRKWQECRGQWALYRVTLVRFNQRTYGPKAEQNHSSLKAIAGGDKSRSLEQNIIDVIKRTSPIFKKKQQFNYKVYADTERDISLITNDKRRSDVAPALRFLEKHSYEAWIKRYDCRIAYNVVDKERNGVKGSLVRHTSRSNDGYFIPDAGKNGIGEICPCEDEFDYGCGCSHFIAKREHCNEPPFCPENIFSVHRFICIIPSSPRVASGELTAFPHHNNPSCEVEAVDQNDNRPVVDLELESAVTDDVLPSPSKDCQ